MVILRSHTPFDMAPTPAKNTKGKQKRTGRSAQPSQPTSTIVVKKPRKVKCSKCIKPHYPPTGAGCLQLPTPLQDCILASNLSSTLVGQDDPSAASIQAQISHISQPISPVRSLPGSPEAQVQLTPVNSDGLQAPTQGLLNIPTSSTQSDPIIPLLQPVPPQPNQVMQDILQEILKNQQGMADKQNVLIEKERVRTAREALNASGGHIDNNNQVDGNRNVVVSEQERWEELSNASMRVGHTVRRATADEPPRATGQHLNSDQCVNNRLVNLEGEAAARRSGGQGAYSSNCNVNDNNQYFNQGGNQSYLNGRMPNPHAGPPQGEFPSVK